jgi:predicted nucleotidyltransferase
LDLPAGIVERLGAILAQQDGVDVAVLFGSAAAGRLRPESDVDVYVRLRRRAAWSGVTVRRVEEALAAVVSRDVHLVVEDEDETSVILRREVARTGKLLWEAQPGAWTGLKAAAMVAYADLEPWLRRCGEGVRRAALAAVETRHG